MASNDRPRAAEQRRQIGTEHGRSNRTLPPLAATPTVTCESTGPLPIDWESMLEHCERWDGMS